MTSGPAAGTDPALADRAPLPAMTVGVIICSHHRPDLLMRCLTGLERQTQRPDDVIIVLQPADRPSHAALADAPPALPWRIVPVLQAGLVAARNAGLAAIRTDIAVFCDDDTVATASWLACIGAHFHADPGLGGVGGRDRCHAGSAADDRRRRRVGGLQWWGRAVGNHHLGFGAPRRADFLKGANMAFRAAAVRGLHFDTRLRGNGAQPDDDLAFSLAVRRAGWRLIYDPAALIDHYAAADHERSYVAQTGLDDPEGFAAACFNHALVIAGHLGPMRRRIFRLWSGLVGTGACPGLVQALRFSLRGDRAAWRKYRLNRAARAEADIVLRSEETTRAARGSALGETLTDTLERGTV